MVEVEHRVDGKLQHPFRVATDMGASHHDNILLVPFFDDPGNL
jgi:hypothetical protein